MQPEIEITRLANGGEGIGRVDGQICFVPNTLPGDVVRLKAVGKRKGVLRGEVVETTHASPLRAKAECPVFGTCGGCSWLDFAYPEQAEWKQRIVQECFARIGKVEVNVGFREEQSLRLGYRTRATFHAGGGAWGFFESRSHKVVPIVACPLCHENLNQALTRLDGVSGPESVEITVDPEGDSVLCWSDAISEGLLEAFPQAQSSNTGGRRDAFEFDGVPVVNGAFVQSSLPLNRILRSTVDELLGDPESLLDLYCGTGNFSLPLAERVEVAGIDHNGISVMAATRVGRGEYRIGDEAAMRAAIEERRWDAILLDPPRTGAAGIMKALSRATCGRVVYVSCDPATLARDARVLINAGWNLKDAIAVDLFPHTPHIETVCLFQR